MTEYSFLATAHVPGRRRTAQGADRRGQEAVGGL